MTKYLTLLSLLIISCTALAETVYVQDVIYVPMRGGASEDHRIIHRGVPSGTPLELIREDEESGFSLVRMQNGTEGWIKTQYISPEPIARDRLREQQQRYEALQDTNNGLQSSLDEMEVTVARLDAEKNSLTLQTHELQDELDTLTNLSADTIKINEENLQLESRNKLLMEELDTLTQMNGRLVDTRDQRWFMIGAATLFMGMLPGFWFARRIYNRRSSGWTD
jgi:SH3 domain protein